MKRYHMNFCFRILYVINSFCWVRKLLHLRVANLLTYSIKLKKYLINNILSYVSVNIVYNKFKYSNEDVINVQKLQ